MTPVIQLEDFFLTQLELRLPTPEKEVSRPATCKVEEHVATRVDDPLLFKLELRVNYKPAYSNGMPDGPELEAAIVGLFSCPEEMEEQKRGAMVRYNGCLILYGLLRGQIATVTGSFPTGKLTLPSFNILDELKKASHQDVPKSKKRASAGKTEGEKSTTKSSKKASKRTKRTSEN